MVSSQAICLHHAFILTYSSRSLPSPYARSPPQVLIHSRPPLAVHKIRLTPRDIIRTPLLS